MKILLFNDNPVVRKLVALSAQKTKDDLSVVWSADEIEGSEYDLLIFDDALYSDEIFESLKEKVSLKSKLLMATRGKGVPEGFDNVINKPFLPTDLVDMFVQIEKKILSSNKKDDTDEEKNAPPPLYAINLEESLPELERHEDGSFKTDGFDETEEDFDFTNLEDFEDTLSETAILDHEEVQEVQGLLDETDEDDMKIEDDIIVQGIDELTIPQDEIALPSELEDDFSFDDEPISDEMEEELLNFDADLKNQGLSLEEELPHNELLDEDDFDDIELSLPIEENGASEEEEFLPMNEETALNLDIEGEIDEMDLSSLMDDEELGDLESKIEEAVSALESDELEKEFESDDLELDFDENLLEDLNLAEEEKIDTDMGVSDDFDELDMLDERELKMAIGEEVDDEATVDTAEDFSLSDESVDEMMSEFEDPFEEEVKEVEVKPSTPANGVEALQTLLKALSNEDVAASLKGMNISININFGNGA